MTGTCYWLGVAEKLQTASQAFMGVFVVFLVLSLFPLASALLDHWDKGDPEFAKVFALVSVVLCVALACSGSVYLFTPDLEYLGEQVRVCKEGGK